MYDEALWKQVERDYADYFAALTESVQKTGAIPHCDSNILHGPMDNCRWCNERRDLQVFRFTHKIAYTGRPAPQGWRPCPADVLRPGDDKERWGGNAAMTPELEQQIVDAYRAMEEMLERHLDALARARAQEAAQEQEDSA